MNWSAVFYRERIIGHFYVGPDGFLRYLKAHNGL